MFGCAGSSCCEILQVSIVIVWIFFMQFCFDNRRRRSCLSLAVDRFLVVRWWTFSVAWLFCLWLFLCTKRLVHFAVYSYHNAVLSCSADDTHIMTSVAVHHAVNEGGWDPRIGSEGDANANCPPFIDFQKNTTQNSAMTTAAVCVIFCPVLPTLALTFGVLVPAGTGSGA